MADLSHGIITDLCYVRYIFVNRRAHNQQSDSMVLMKLMTGMLLINIALCTNRRLVYFSVQLLKIFRLCTNTKMVCYTTMWEKFGNQSVTVAAVI